MSDNHPGGQWVNGCNNPDYHKVGDCAGPTYSDGSVEAELVDAALGDALTQAEQRLAAVRALCDAEDARVAEVNARLQREGRNSTKTGQPYRIGSILPVHAVRAAIDGGDDL